jgi:hypothetical protein
VSELIEQHRRACEEFSRVAALVLPDQWDRPSPCTDPSARWEATRAAMFGALDMPGAIDEATDLPGGGRSTPRAMLGALTTEVLVHSWDLARATDQSPAPAVLDAAIAYGRDPDWRA